MSYYRQIGKLEDSLLNMSSVGMTKLIMEVRYCPIYQEILKQDLEKDLARVTFI